MRLGVKDRDDILKLREDGKTLQEIANMYGVSRQYVHQLLNSDKYNSRFKTDKYKEMKRKYYAKNKQMYKDSYAKWKAKHPNYFKGYYAQHRDKIIAAALAWKEKKKKEKDTE